MAYLTKDDFEAICKRIDSGEKMRLIALDYERTEEYMSQIYRRTRGISISEVRALRRPKVRRRTKMYQRNMEYLRQFAFEPFDEPGWEGFGMFVLERDSL